MAPRTSAGWSAELSQLLRRMRDDRRHGKRPTFRWIAERSGYSASYISEVFNGHKAPEPEAVAAIITALGGDRGDVEVGLTIAGRLDQVASLPSSYAIRPMRVDPLMPVRPDPGDIEDLLAWCDNPGSPDVLLVHGSAGAGKSAAAAVLAVRSQAAGWGVWEGLWPPVPAAGRPGRRSRSRRIVIVEDADLWPAAVIADLIGETADVAGISRTVLVGRSAGPWWQIVRSRLERVGLTAGSRYLESAATGTQPWGAAVSVLRSERRRWSLIQDTEAGQGSTVADIVERLTLAACLCGPLPYDRAIDLAAAVGGLDGDQSLRWHGRCCPPIDGGSTVLHAPCPQNAAPQLIALWAQEQANVQILIELVHIVSSSLPDQLRPRLHDRLGAAARRAPALQTLLAMTSDRRA